MHEDSQSSVFSDLKLFSPLKLIIISDQNVIPYWTIVGTNYWRGGRTQTSFFYLELDTFMYAKKELEKVRVLNPMEGENIENFMRESGCERNLSLESLDNFELCIGKGNLKIYKNWPCRAKGHVEFRASYRNEKSEKIWALKPMEEGNLGKFWTRIVIEEENPMNEQKHVDIM